MTDFLGVASQSNPFNQDLNTTDLAVFAGVTVVASPILSTDLTNKAYVDGASGNPFNQDLNTTDSVIFAGLSTTTITDVLTMDGQPGGDMSIAVGCNNCHIGAATGVSSASFMKTGGTSIQYLMANGDSLTASANSGNSNFYLYNSISGAGSPPITPGDIEYNNTVQDNASIIYVSVTTRDSIDIEVYFGQITTVSQIYLQDQADSANFIRYGISSAPTIVPGDYISIPVIMVDSAGTGASSFGASAQIMFAVFTDTIEIDVRLSALESKTQNITAAVPSSTTLTGDLTASSYIVPAGLSTSFLKADGSQDTNTYLTTSGGSSTYLPLTGGTLSGNLTAPSYIVPAGLSTSFLKANGTQDTNDYLTTASASSTYLPLTGGTLSGNLTAPSYIVPAGLSTSFLKADGSQDTNTYLTTSGGSSTYLPLAGGTLSGNLTAPSYIVPAGLSTSFLKADGSQDTNNYLSTASASSTYLPLAGGTLSGNLTSPSYIVPAGLSTSFLKANGSQDTNTYLTTANASSTYLTTANASSTYLPLTGGTLSGNLTAPSYIVPAGLSTSFLKANGTQDTTTTTTINTLKAENLAQTTQFNSYELVPRGSRDTWVPYSGGTTLGANLSYFNSINFLYATGNASSVAYSQDGGVVWSLCSTVGLITTSTPVAYNGAGEWMFASDQTSPFNTHVSTNGTSFALLSTVSNIGNVSGNVFIYFAGLYVISVSTVGQYIGTSPDGTTWTPQACTTHAIRGAVGKDDLDVDMLVVVGSAGPSYSYDAITWTVGTGMSVSTRAITYSSERKEWLANVMSGGGIYRSTDGKAWTLLSTSSITSANTMMWVGYDINQYYIPTGDSAGNYTLSYSADGMLFRNVKMAGATTNNTVYGLVYMYAYDRFGVGNNSSTYFKYASNSRHISSFTDYVSQTGYSVVSGLSTSFLKADGSVDLLTTPKLQNQSAVANITTFVGAITCPTYDTSAGLLIGNTNATSIGIGKTGIITTLTGTSLNVITRTNCPIYDRSSAGALSFGLNTQNALTIGKPTVANSLFQGLFVNMSMPPYITTSTTTPTIANSRIPLTKFFMTPSTSSSLATTSTPMATGGAGVATTIASEQIVGSCWRYKFNGLLATSAINATIAFAVAYSAGSTTFFTLTIPLVTASSTFEGSFNVYFTAVGTVTTACTGQGYISYKSGSVLELSTVNFANAVLSPAYDVTSGSNTNAVTFTGTNATLVINSFVLEAIR